jgi:hypothetical protein
MIYYITVATEEKLYLPYLKQLLPELVILGMNTKWEGWVYRYKLIIKYLDLLNENDIVCFMDAYDVLPTKNIVQLEDKFVEFMKHNPEVKMIVGYEIIDNKFMENYIQSIMGTVNNDRINAGTYIGYVKNIKHILSSILVDNPNMQDDQLELTKYANKFPNEIYIDKQTCFFKVFVEPLQNIEISKNQSYCFVHAAGNGLLENMSLSEYGIIVNDLDKYNNYKDNLKSVIKKYFYLGIELPFKRDFSSK